MFASGANLPQPGDILMELLKKAVKDPNIINTFLMDAGWKVYPSALRIVRQYDTYTDLPPEILQQAERHGEDFFPALILIQHILCHASHQWLISNKQLALPEEMKDPMSYELMIHLIHHHEGLCTLHHIQMGYKLVLSVEDAEIIIQSEIMKHSGGLSRYEMKSTATEDMGHENTFIVHHNNEFNRIYWKPSWENAVETKPDNEGSNTKTEEDDIVVTDEQLSAFKDFIDNMNF